MLKKAGVPDSWVLLVEHTVLRAISLGCSLAAAYSIHLVLATLGLVDFGELVIGWVVAVGCGFGGYIVSRALVYRVMRRERVVWFIPIFLIVEFADLGSNYMLATLAVDKASMLDVASSSQRVVLTVIWYGLLMVSSVMALSLAPADMELERKKGEGVLGVVGRAVSPPPGPNADSRPTWARGNAGKGSGSTTIPARAGASDNAGQGAAASANGTSGTGARDAARQGSLVNQWRKRQEQQNQGGAQGGQGSAKNLLDDLEKTLVAP